MSISYNPTIPQPLDNPSISQGQFLTNFGGINQWTNIDHLQFSDPHAGQHQLVNFPANAPPPSPADLASVLYTAPGTASNTTSEAFFRNAGTTLLLSAVKAFGIVDGSNGNLLNGYNATTSRTGTGAYRITVGGSSVTGSNFSVLCSCAPALSGPSRDQMLLTYQISGNVITIITVNESGPFGADVISFSFAILQL